MHLLDIAGAVTGGTPGLALLLGHVLPVPFGVLYVAVSLPFLVLAALPDQDEVPLPAAAEMREPGSHVAAARGT